MLPLDPLEEFYGRGEAAIRPGEAVGAYGPIAPLPADFEIFPGGVASDLDTPIWSRRFASLFPFKGGQVLRRVASVLLPSVPIAPFNPEDLYPDEVLGWAATGSAQVAVQQSTVICYNVLTSGVRIILEEWQATRINTAGFINVMTITQPPDNTWTQASNRFRDARRGFTTGLNSASQLIVAAGNTANPGILNGTTIVGLVGSGAGQAGAVSQRPIVLDPGSGIVWEPTIVNEGINVSLWWRAKLIQVSPNKVP